MTIEEMEFHRRDNLGLCNRCRNKKHEEDFHKRFDIKEDK